jgi:hypothetical protein
VGRCIVRDVDDQPLAAFSLLRKSADSDEATWLVATETRTDGEPLNQSHLITIIGDAISRQLRSLGQRG